MMLESGVDLVCRNTHAFVFALSIMVVLYRITLLRSLRCQASIFANMLSMCHSYWRPYRAIVGKTALKIFNLNFDSIDVWDHSR